MLLFGGESSEHTISVSSARNVFAALDNAKYNAVLGYIDSIGKWWLIDKLTNQIDTTGLPQLLPILGTGAFSTMPNGKIIKPDVIFPILHGLNGESIK